MGTQVSHPVSWQASAVCEGAHDVSSILPYRFAASSLSEEMLATVLKGVATARRAAAASRQFEMYGTLAGLS